MQQSAEVYIFAEVGMKREWEMFEGDLAETSNSAKSLPIPVCPFKVGMKREWEMAEGEKKGRSTREAKRSVHHMLMIMMLYMFTCSYPHICSYVNA